MLFIILRYSHAVYFLMPLLYFYTDFYIKIIPFVLHTDIFMLENIPLQNELN